MVLARIVVDNTMGVFEMLDSEQSMGRLRKRELAPLTPYVKGIENKHKVSASCAGVTCLAMGCPLVVLDSQAARRKTQKEMKEAFKKHKRQEKLKKRKELEALNKVRRQVDLHRSSPAVANTV